MGTEIDFPQRVVGRAYLHVILDNRKRQQEAPPPGLPR